MNWIEKENDVNKFNLVIFKNLLLSWYVMINIENYQDR